MNKVENDKSFSPIKAKRSEEKANLQMLNSRLQNYTMKVASMREQNASAQAEIDQIRSRNARELNNLKERYEKEIETLRKDLEDETDQRSRLQVLEQEHKSELDHLRPLSQELKDLRIRTDALETNLRCSEELNKTLSVDLEQCKLENQGIYRRISILEKESKTASHIIQNLQDENEKLRLENSQFHEGNDKAISKFNREQATKLEALYAQFKTEQEERTAKSIQEVRSHCDNVIKQNEARLEELTKENEGLKKELDSTSINLDEQAKLLQDARELARHVEIQLRQEQKKRKEERQALEKDLERAQEARLAKENEFNELMDIKIALDSEIAAYSSILEREESRVGIDTPKKRRRTINTSSNSSSKKKNSHSTILITSLDVKNGCVTLENKGEEQISLKGWIVKSATTFHTFTFPEDYIIPPMKSVCVWSGKRNKTRKKSPHDLFWMKKSVWNPEGDAAILVNPDGNVESFIAEGMEFPQEILNKMEDSDFEQTEEEKTNCILM